MIFRKTAAHFSGSCFGARALARRLQDQLQDRPLKLPHQLDGDLLDLRVHLVHVPVL
jgi:hypothetical protein